MLTLTLKFKLTGLDADRQLPHAFGCRDVDKQQSHVFGCGNTDKQSPHTYRIVFYEFKLCAIKYGNICMNFI